MINNQGVSHQDGVRSVDCDLVVRGVAARQPQVEVLDVEVHVRQDELALDVVPDKKKRQHNRAGELLLELYNNQHLFDSIVCMCMLSSFICS